MAIKAKLLAVGLALVTCVAAPRLAGASTAQPASGGEVERALVQPVDFQVFLGFGGYPAGYFHYGPGPYAYRPWYGYYPSRGFLPYRPYFGSYFVVRPVPPPVVAQPGFGAGFFLGGHPHHSPHRHFHHSHHFRR